MPSTWLADNKWVFSPFSSDSFLPSCHSLNFFSGDQSPASSEGRFDFGKSPRSLRGSSGQGGRRLVIKPRKEHPLDVQMGSTPARGRTSFSGASSASLERGQSCWEPWFYSAGQGVFWGPPRGQVCTSQDGSSGHCRQFRRAGPGS